MTDDLTPDSPQTAREIPEGALREWLDDPQMYRDRYESAIDAALYARRGLGGSRAGSGVDGACTSGSAAKTPPQVNPARKVHRLPLRAAKTRGIT